MSRLFLAASASIALLLSAASSAFADGGDRVTGSTVKSAVNAKGDPDRKSRVKPVAKAVSKTKSKSRTAALPGVSRTSGYAAKPAVSPAIYAGIISKYAKTYGVPEELAHAVVRIESNFNPKARGSAGEIGLMQIKPATARMMGYVGGTKGLYDPDTNIRYGMKYLAAAHELGGGETCGTILRYNAGHGATRMNPVSKRYCGKVLAMLD